MRLLMSFMMLCGFASNSYAATQQSVTKDDAVLVDQLRRINPNVVGAFKDGLERMRAKDYRAAAAQFQKVVNGAPTFEDAYNRLATCLTSSGNLEQAITTMAKAVELNRSYENLMNLALLETFSDGSRKATPETQQRALRLMMEANRKKSDASMLFVTASLAMQLKQHQEFSEVTQQMMRDFPEKPESHYLNAILAASNGEWKIAEEEIRRAGDFGVPPETVRQFLDTGVHRRGNEWRYATYVGYAAMAFVGFALLFLIGKALSKLTLRR